MLTADLACVRKHKGKLFVVPLGKREPIARELARDLVALARDHVERTREELDEAWASLEVEPRDQKIKDALIKLTEDALIWQSDEAFDPVALRAEVFLRAAEARRARTFDRAAILDEIERKHGWAAGQAIERLYSDLRSAQKIAGIEPLDPERMIDDFELSQSQAVLLRATRVVVELENTEPAALRSLLRKLKFLRLLFVTERVGSTSIRITIDGPFSMFESVTKYGLTLALALPSLISTGSYALRADVRWGKERTPLLFEMEGAPRGRETIPPRLPEEVEALRCKLERDGEWHVALADTILDLPGVGAVVPDLLLQHRATGRAVHLEVLGYWSRDAVWRRVELVERGLPDPILFCVSERLRVSESVLPTDAPAALLVYKGVLSAKAVLERARNLLEAGADSEAQRGSSA